MRNCTFICKKNPAQNKQNYLTVLHGEKDLFEWSLVSFLSVLFCCCCFVLFCFVFSCAGVLCTYNLLIYTGKFK